MSPNGKKENLLTSWKEIAAYLDRDVRTCIRWEKSYALPIHRLDKDSKAKVFAYTDEIDRWLQARSEHVVHDHRRLFAGAPAGRLFVVLVLLILAGAGYFLVPGLRSDRVPADFRIRGSSLIIVNERGRVLWSKETGLAGLEDEAFYREHFQTKELTADYLPVWPCLMIKDINRDGHPEILFAPKTRDESRDGDLFCYDWKGHEMWHFAAGRELAFGAKIFRKEYRISGFGVEDYGGDGKPEILVISYHKPDWPCQIAILDGRGHLQGEYWNSGYLMDAESGDVDGDGKKELVLSGVNNEYKKGCLAVFKAGHVGGSSPQRDPAFKCASLGPGTQTAYILFPPADFHVFIGEAGDPVNYLWIHEGAGLAGVMHDTRIYFDFNRRLECTSVTLSNITRDLYAKLLQQGAVRGPLDKNYEEKLAAGVLYYENGAWVNKRSSGPDK